MEQFWVQVPKFWIGVLSSLVAGGIFWAVSQQAWPRLRNRLQKVPVISGNWKSTFEEEDVTMHEEVEVTQVGQKISGTMMLSQEEGVAVRFTFRGTIQSGVIKGLYESESTEGFEQGAFVLGLNPRGDLATGQYIYFLEPDGGSAEITPVKYEWKRS